MPAVDLPKELLDQPEYRVEGPLKVTGAARFTADVKMPGMLYLAYTRSPLPHARIAEATALVDGIVDPPDDARGSAAYKRRMARVWTERALRSLRDQPDQSDERH